MHRISHWLSRHAAALFFPAALILYDFSAYLTTDLIQPGILHVVRDFNADVALAPASVSLYMAGGMALQWLLGPLSDRIGRRPVLLTGALIFTLACLATLFTTSMTQFLITRFVQGTSICFIATVGYVTVQEAFEEKRSIRLMAVITSVVLVAPIVGPLSGAALMHFIHWKALFGIIAAMGLVAWLGLLLTMPETVRRGDVPFSPLGVLRDFRNVFRNRIFLLGAATLSLSYIPLMSWVAVSPVILMDAGGLTTSEFAWSQVPVFSAVIIANLGTNHAPDLELIRLGVEILDGLRVCVDLLGERCELAAVLLLEFLEDCLVADAEVALLHRLCDDGSHLIARHRAVALERAVAHAVDHAVLSEIVERVVRPMALRHIAEAVSALSSECRAGDAERQAEQECSCFLVEFHRTTSFPRGAATRPLAPDIEKPSTETSKPPHCLSMFRQSRHLFLVSYCIIAF